MRTTSEVCKAMGVTRKTLRGYDKIGLLHPTEKTDSGYWLYDDESVYKLAMIQMFVKAGCTRQKVERLLQNSKDESEVLSQLLTILEEKEREIQNYIRAVKIMQQTKEMPEFVKQAWEKEIVRNNNTSFSEKLNNAINASESVDEKTLINAPTFIPFLYGFYKYHFSVLIVRLALI